MPRIQIVSWIRQMMSGNSIGRVRPSTKKKRHLLHLEHLEDRITPNTYTVSDLADNPSDIYSVRYAVDQVNADSSSSDTIAFSNTLSGTIKLINGPLALTRPSGTFNITGPGASALTISGESTSGVFGFAYGETVMLSGLTIANGNAEAGGGIANSGMLTVANTVFLNNSATVSGGGIFNGTATAINESPNGIGSSDMTVTVSSSSSFPAVPFVAQIGAEQVQVTAVNTSTNQWTIVRGFNGTTAVAHPNGSTIFVLGTTLTVTGSTFSGNSAGNSGGAIESEFATLIASGSTFAGNSATAGAGIMQNDGALTVSNSTFSGNAASQFGGGLSVFDDGLTPIVSATVTDSTISGNSATYGGGLIVNGALALVDTTVANNVANSGSGGGFYLFGGSAVSLLGTIVAGNSNNGTDGSDDIAGSANLNLTESAFNLIGTGGSGGLTSTNNNQVNVNNPGLNALGNYGGPTETITLQSGSPALLKGSSLLTTLGTALGGLATDTTLTVNDATFVGVGEVIAIGSEQMQITAINGTTVTVTRGFNSTAVTAYPMGASLVLPTDQRGFARSVGGFTDVGAVETQPPPALSGLPAVNGSNAVINIVSASGNGSTATITTDPDASGHGFWVGELVTLKGTTPGGPGGLAGTFTVTGVPSATSFQFTSTYNGSETLTGATVFASLAGAQRSMVDSIVYKFTEPVTLTAAAFTVTAIQNSPGSTVGVVPTVNVAAVPFTNEWVVTFTSPVGGSVVGNSIANGAYTIAINPALVTAVSDGQNLAAGETDTFYRLYGDVTGVQSVKNVDANAFNRAWGNAYYSANFNAALDYNDDGKFTNIDANAFNRAFNTRYSVTTTI